MIYVIDEMMGRGKTSAMINHINNSPDDKRFLFITPYLGEVTRIKKACAAKRFYEPMEIGTKSDHIKDLIRGRSNIVSTHYLFSLFTQETCDLLRDAGYTLIVDEAQSISGGLTTTKYDTKFLKRLVTISDDDGVAWNVDDYEGVYDKYKDVIKSGNVYQYNDSFWVTIMPPELFRVFDDIYIMTYMFQDQMQRCYFDMVGLPYQYLYVSGDNLDNYAISPVRCPAAPVDYSRLIHIVDDPELNEIGDAYHSLSKSWYTKNAGTYEIRQLGKNCRHFFKSDCKAKSADCLWTTFKCDNWGDKNWVNAIAGKGGFKKGFLPCNARATNDFRERTSVAYLINRFPNAVQFNFFAKKGVKLDRNKFALSEMLQWIWRSGVRDGKEIRLYMPSSRMRGLLVNWIKEQASAH